MATDMLKQHRTGFMHKGLFSSPDSGKVRRVGGGNLSDPRSDFSKPPINEQHQVSQASITPRRKKRNSSDTRTEI